LACANAGLQNHLVSEKEKILPEPLKVAFAASVISGAVSEGLEVLHRGREGGGQPTTLLYDLHELSSTSLLVGRVPECPACWPASTLSVPNSARRIAIPALFEECSRSRTAATFSEGTELPSQSIKSSQACRTRTYPNSLKVPLPPWPVLYREREVPPKGVLRVREISSLLFLAFGRWNRANSKQPDRVLPSAGNLGSPAAFLIARNVDGLEAGAYFYLEASHELARIESAAMGSLEDIFSGLHVGADSDLPDALLVMIGDYARIGVKYGAFGYRLVHFDSGIFVAHLRTIAHSLLLTTHEMSSWPERMLTQRLAIDPEESPITATIAFSAYDHKRLRQSTPPVGTQVKESAPPSFLPPEIGSAADLARHIERMSLRERLPNWGPVRSHGSSGSLEEKSSLFLSHAELWNHLLMRQSVRNFEDKPIAPSVMADILRRTRKLARLRDQYPLAKVLATLRSGCGTQPTWQTFDLSKDERVVAYRNAAYHGGLDEVFVHPPPAKAPLIFWLCGDVRKDAWLYKRMLLEAGQQSYDLMQEAFYCGLEGVLVGGIWPRKASSVLGLHYCDESPLLAFACGLALSARGE
jgi:SagB-type dehydrogenase family enzyme